MAITRPTLGTLLRRLVEQLDGAVEQSYVDAGLDYRPRYTPIIRALINHGPATIRALAERSGVTHSAASQTITQMARVGLVSLAPGEDARERIVSLTPLAEELAPTLERHWAATEAAARTLDDDLGQSLPDLLIRVLEILDRHPFAERIAAAKALPPKEPS